MTTKKQEGGGPMAGDEAAEVQPKDSKKGRPSDQANRRPGMEGMSPEEIAELEEFERAAAESFEKLGRAASQIGEQASDAYQTSRTFVRDNMGGTLLTSFVIGVVMGVLISKR